MSFNLQESVLLLQDQDETIPIQNELDVPAMSEGEAMDYLERESLYRASCRLPLMFEGRKER